MDYIALYRRFRPLTFNDMVGQDHISQILKNQIINDRVGHAYLFSGIRGTGKTSTAKIFARAVNCENPVDGEPCNECEICKSILDGTSTDVTEIDAASNNSVDNIRNIREEVMYVPTKAKYRIYIIDEVHMLSTGAFNALLKTLEEPPKHVKFILATTEPNKLPATILSRCQRFDFKRISNDNIVKKLEDILNGINKKADKDALNIIANLSDGALRDAISILDRCVNDTDNITADYVANLVGIPSGVKTLEVIENIFNNNSQDMIFNINNILNEGQNISVLLDEIIKKMCNILIYLKTNEIKIYNQEEIEKLKQVAKLVSPEKISNCISDISKIQNDIKWAKSDEIVAISGLIRLCVQTKNDNLDDVKLRIEKIENEIKDITKNGVSIVNNNSIQNQKADQEKQDSKEVSVNQATEKEIITGVNEEQEVYEVQDVKEEVNPQTENYETKDVQEWREILTNLREQGRVNIFTGLVNATASYIADDVIGIYFKADFAKNMIDTPTNTQIIKKVVEDVTGRAYDIRCFLETEKKEDSKFSKIKKTIEQFDIPMDIIDE